VPLPSSALLTLLPDGWEARNNKRKAREEELAPREEPEELDLLLTRS